MSACYLVYEYEYHCPTCTSHVYVSHVLARWLDKWTLDPPALRPKIEKHCAAIFEMTPTTTGEIFQLRMLHSTLTTTPTTAAAMVPP